jgi:hypothetical protein
VGFEGVKNNIQRKRSALLLRRTNFKYEDRPLPKFQTYQDFLKHHKMSSVSGAPEDNMMDIDRMVDARTGIQKERQTQVRGATRDTLGAQIVTDGTTQPPKEESQKPMKSTQQTQEQGTARDNPGAKMVTGGTSDPLKEDGQKYMVSTQEDVSAKNNGGVKQEVILTPQEAPEYKMENTRLKKELSQLARENVALK